MVDRESLDLRLVVDLRQGLYVALTVLKLEFGLPLLLECWSQI